jgi:hypothetical protein
MGGSGTKITSKVIVLYAWAPHTNSRFTIVKSAMRLINSWSGTAQCSFGLRVVAHPAAWPAQPVPVPQSTTKVKFSTIRVKFSTIVAGEAR